MAISAHVTPAAIRIELGNEHFVRLAKGIFNRHDYGRNAGKRTPKLPMSRCSFDAHPGITHMDQMKLLFCTLGLLGVVGTLVAAQPGGDGLILHIDASAQPSARAAASLPPIGRLQPVDMLVDTSTNARVSVQAAA